MKIKLLRFILIGFNSSVFIIYSIAKFTGIQFSKAAHYSDNMLLKDVKDYTLMWKFYGSSPVYSIFIASAQLLSALLIIFPITRKIGLLFYLFGVVNIVLINFCFGLPNLTKALSVLLLANTLIIISTYYKDYVEISRRT